MHIEADMVNPMHEIQMLSEHQVVEYGPVPFARKSTMLWLPKNVEIYFDFGKHHYYRHYTFDNYMLFDVDASENKLVARKLGISIRKPDRKTNWHKENDSTYKGEEVVPVVGKGTLDIHYILGIHPITNDLYYKV